MDTKKDRETRARVILQHVKDIPSGCVSTYGDIAQLVYGKRRNGRAVASAIKAEEQRNDDFPWWRVVDSKLRIRTGGTSQRERLKMEGVTFTEGQLVQVRSQYRQENG